MAGVIRAVVVILCLLREVACTSAGSRFRGSVKSDPLAGVKHAIGQRIQHLKSQQLADETPADRCKRQAAEVDKKIAQNRLVVEKKEAELQATGTDVDRCIYSGKYINKECYDYKQAKSHLGNYLEEKELMHRQCAIQPMSYEERALRRDDEIDKLKTAHDLLSQR
mmetsp:Transcript_63628/g.112986  ORF Transcript_63628/g.112986 Transcript_63628/m.112986 type:complete len:166 (+) Transcript_63628:62-559(+)